MNLRSTLYQLISHWGFEKTYWIAYSGGLDSSVLLALCAELRLTLPLKLQVIHINHGLSPQAKTWVNHCEIMCQQWQLDFVCYSIQLDLKAGQSLEEVARHKRYEIFAKYLGEGDVLLTAHHEDDQAETFLSQLLRGAGVKGLASMPMLKPFARGYHARPLLHFNRATLEEYANTQQLNWINDESNENIKLTRNFIRHQMLAPLKKHWPSVTTTIARSAAHCAETDELLNIFAQEKLKSLTGFYPNTLSVSKLIQLAPAIQRLVLRSWIGSQNYSLPNTKKLDTILQQILKARWDRLPYLSWGEVELRRYRDDLFLLSLLKDHDAKQTFAWNMIEPLHLPSIGYLQAALQQGAGLRADVTKNISVRFRQGGEVIRLSQRGMKTLKNLFQEWNVLPWMRNRMPLLFVENELAAIPGYCVAEKYAARPSEEGYTLSFQPEENVF